MVPLAPVMAVCNSVKLIAEMAGLQHGGESVVCGQKTFLIAASKKKVWSLSRIGGTYEDKRIAGATALASPGTKNRAVLPVLTNPFDGKRTAGNIKRRTESTRKHEEIRMLQCKHNRAESSHGHAGNGAMLAPSCGRKPLLHIGNEVMHDVVFIAVLRTIG